MRFVELENITEIIFPTFVACQVPLRSISCLLRFFIHSLFPFCKWTADKWVYFFFLRSSVDQNLRREKSIKSFDGFFYFFCILNIRHATAKQIKWEFSLCSSFFQRRFQVYCPCNRTRMSRSFTAAWSYQIKNGLRHS